MCNLHSFQTGVPDRTDNYNTKLSSITKRKGSSKQLPCNNDFCLFRQPGVNTAYDKFTSQSVSYMLLDLNHDELDDNKIAAEILEKMGGS